MKNATYNSGKMNYEAISKEVRELYEGIEAFKKKRNSIAENFKVLSEYIGHYQFTNSFPVLEKEINETIGKWTVSEPLDKLRLQLDGYFSKIAFIDQEIGKIETLQQKLLQHPDRHKRKAVTDKIIIFLQNANKASLSQLDRICNETIPNIHKMIEVVLLGFSEEDDNVEKNKKAARHLKKRIDGYRQYVDRFNLRQICAEANRVAEQVLQSPNMVNPESDAAKLKQVNHSLDQCMAQFKAEDKLYDDIKETLRENRMSVWLEDYDALMSVLGKGAFYEDTPASQLQARYDSFIGVKNKNITNALNVFSHKYQLYFSNEIKSLRAKAHYKSELHDLIYKMNRKVEDDKKALYFKIAKIVGIIAAIIAIAVIVWNTRPISFFVIGAIVILILYMIFKK